MSARKFGGEPGDYLALHSWMDHSKGHFASCTHRMILHNAWGIFAAERVLGVTFNRASDGKELPVRPVLEQHVVEDLGEIPTLERALGTLQVEGLDESDTYAHAERDVERWGGAIDDYLPIHEFLDSTRAYLPDLRHRRLLHTSWGVWMAERIFGRRPGLESILTVGDVAREHIRSELGRVPTLVESTSGLTLEAWMCRRARPLSILSEKGTA